MSLFVIVLWEGSVEFIVLFCMELLLVVFVIVYGNVNCDIVFQCFKQEFFNQYFVWWVWLGVFNFFGQWDMGYYIGYVLFEYYYN